MIDAMPNKLSSFNFFIIQDRDSSVSLPLGDGGILQCHVGIDAPSLFWGQATSDLALTFCIHGPEAEIPETPGKRLTPTCQAKGFKTALQAGPISRLERLQTRNLSPFARHATKS
jgi:hypothetical protein